MATPLSTLERTKAREDQRKFENDKSLLALKNFSEQIHAQRINALSNVKEYSILYLRTMFLLNGGAIVALLSFVGTAIFKSDQNFANIAVEFARNLRPAFICFTYGVVCCGITLFFAFVNWYAEARKLPNPTKIYEMTLNSSDPPLQQEIPLHIKTLILLGRALGVASLIFFAIGAAVVASAFGTFGISAQLPASI